LSRPAEHGNGGLGCLTRGETERGCLTRRRTVPLWWDTRPERGSATRSPRCAGPDRVSAVVRIGTVEPPPGWLVDNLADTQAEMFALLLQAWAAGPGVWSDFPRVQAPTSVICGENEEPDAAPNARMAAGALPDAAAARRLPPRARRRAATRQLA